MSASGVVGLLDLWDLVRFSSIPALLCVSAMEDCAGLAVPFLRPRIDAALTCPFTHWPRGSQPG